MDKKYSDKTIKKYQDLHKRRTGAERTEGEAELDIDNLVGLFDILLGIEKKDWLRKEKLKEFPSGFPFDDGGHYTCPICRQDMCNEQVWYDKDGMKCVHCQKALDKKIIPASVCKRDGSWYAIWEFDHFFSIKSPAIRRFIRSGQLKSRVIPSLHGGKHFELFLIKDNKGILPEKPKSFWVKGENNMVHVEYEQVTLPDFLEECRTKKKPLEITISGK